MPPPGFGGFRPSERVKRTPRTPHRGALGGGGTPPSSPGPAQDPPNGLFWAQKWSKTVLPKNDPACFGRVYGAYSNRLGPISGLFWLGFRPPLAPKRRLVRNNSAGQQARTHAGEGCRLADNNNYYTPLPIIRTSKQQASKQATTTSRHRF